MKKPNTGGVECGDHVYLQHATRGPIAVRVTACGKDGMTGRCEQGQRHTAGWDTVLGVRHRRPITAKLVEQGADGAILEESDGKRRYVEGEVPMPEQPAEPVTPQNDDPLTGGLGKLKKAMTMFGTSRVMFFKAGGQIANRAGLALKDVTDKGGHQTKRWTKTGQEQPAEKPKAGAPMQHGGVVAFRHGDVEGKGKVVASGQHGVTVADETGREHQVRHEHLIGPHKEPANDTAANGNKAEAGGDVKPADSAGESVSPDQFKATSIYERDNDPNATIESVLKGFPPDTADKISETQKKLAGVTETYKEHMKDGEYTPERQALHKKIIKHILSPEKIEAARPADGEPPTFTILGGRGGSGKSWFNGKVFDPSKAIVLDADEIKHMIPEYEGWNAFQVHEESGHLFDALTDMAEGMRLNLVHDATMKTAKKAVALVKRFKDGGSRVEAHYMHLPRQEAAKRAIGRFLGPTGRFVPPDVVLLNTGNEAAFDAVKGMCDKWSFRDNNVSKGQEPKLISESGNETESQGSVDSKGDAGKDGQLRLPSGSEKPGSGTGLHPKDDEGRLGKCFVEGRRVIFLKG